MKTFLVASITIFSLNSFALSNSILKEAPKLIHVYCEDGSYAGDIYDMGSVDNAEMAQAMCE